MIEIPQGKFEDLVNGMTFVELEFSPKSKTQWSDSKFYGLEIGNNVMVIQKWNEDFCTASFKIPDAQIVSCNGKYTIMPSNYDTEIPQTKLELRSADMLSEPVIESPVDQDPSIEERFAAIEGSVSDAGPTLSKQIYDDPRDDRADIVLEAAKDSVQISIPTVEQPIMAKGRAKPEETKTPAPQTVVKRQPKPEYVKPVQSPRNVEPTPSSTPKRDFGDW